MVLSVNFLMFTKKDLSNNALALRSSPSEGLNTPSSLQSIQQYQSKFFSKSKEILAHLLWVTQRKCPQKDQMFRMLSPDQNPICFQEYKIIFTG